MGFTKRTWKNRMTEYPNRRLLTKEDGSTELVTVSREEGQISEEGDAFDKDNMNDLEDRIYNAVSPIDNLTQSVKAIQVVTELPADAASHTDTLYLVTG